MRREASGFLTSRDKEIVGDFIKNMRNYMRHVDLYEMTKTFYDRRQQELKERLLNKNGSIDVSKVTDDHLYDAGVSKREVD